jgi:hypothetical protein
LKSCFQEKMEPEDESWPQANHQLTSQPDNGHTTLFCQSISLLYHYQPIRRNADSGWDDLLFIQKRCRRLLGGSNTIKLLLSALCSLLSDLRRKMRHMSRSPSGSLCTPHSLLAHACHRLLESSLCQRKGQKRSRKADPQVEPKKHLVHTEHKTTRCGGLLSVNLSGKLWPLAGC